MDRIAAVKLSATTRRLIREALAEDIGAGDVTSRSIFGPGARASALVIARKQGVICGADIAAEVFRALDRRLRVRVLRKDGASTQPGAALLDIRGPVLSILSAERTALNFLQRLSGIATLAAAFTRAVRATGCRILDTRKTTPGWRELEKYAVRCGGATNHRMRLDDLALIKDNHLAALPSGRPIAEVVRRVRRKHRKIRIVVECDRLSQVRQAAAAGADRVLLDNMSIPKLRAAVKLARPSRVKLEASGGVTLKNVRRIAKTGVHFISVGALTHSAPALDFSLELKRSREAKKQRGRKR